VRWIGDRDDDLLEWCGPAPLRPFNTNIHPGGWRQYLDYGNGQLGDWGVHWLDQVLWWSEEKYPRRIYSTAGRPIWGPAVLNDKEQTSDAPDHQVAVYEFEKFTCVWEHRRFAGNHAEKHLIGSYYYGTKGTLHIGWRESKYKLSSSPDWTVFGKGYDKVASFKGKIENFSHALRGKEELFIKPADALASVQVIEAAYKSMNQNLWQPVIEKAAAAR